MISDDTLQIQDEVEQALQRYFTSPAYAERKWRASQKEEDRQRQAWVDDVWASYSVPIIGTPADSYLRRRGFRYPDEGSPDDLVRFSPCQQPKPWVFNRNPGGAAVIAPMRNRRGKMVALLIIHLNRDGTRAYKLTVGKPKGAAVRLPAMTDSSTGIIAIGEGLETVWSVWQVLGFGVECWAVGGKANLRIAPIRPKDTNEILLLLDNDTNSENWRENLTDIRRCLFQFRKKGHRVLITVPPKAGWDFNDMLLNDGDAAVSELIAKARVFHQDNHERGNRR